MNLYSLMAIVSSYASTGYSPNPNTLSILAKADKIIQMATDKKNIGIIGYGNMGRTIVGQLKSKYQIFVFDKDKNKTQKFEGIHIAQDNIDLVNKVDNVILAVKPQDFDSVLDEINDYIKNRLIISIAAGVSTGYIEKQLPKAHIIRAMPNLPVKVGEGMICLCKGKYASNTDLDFAQELFSCLGTTILIEENLMDAATAVSGSGPGYLYDLIKDKNKEEWEIYTGDFFIPLLSKSAEEVGFACSQAQILARVTAQGSMILLKESGLTPKELCIQVASKGGTTEAGLEVLHRGGSLQEAVMAAKKHAEKLAKKE